MVKFVLGENKYIKLLVKSRNKKPFIVSLATWELFRNKELESSGGCDITQEDTFNYIRTKISPEYRGNYVLIISYHVADEILKERILIEVV